MITGVALLPRAGSLLSGMEKSADKQPAEATKNPGKSPGSGFYLSREYTLCTEV